MRLIKQNNEFYLLSDKEFIEGKEYNSLVANFDGKDWHIFETNRFFPSFKEVIASTKAFKDTPLMHKHHLQQCNCGLWGYEHNVRHPFIASQMKTNVEVLAEEYYGYNYEDSKKTTDEKRSAMVEGYQQGISDTKNELLKWIESELKKAYENNIAVFGVYVDALNSFRDKIIFPQHQQNSLDVEIELDRKSIGVGDWCVVSPKVDEKGYITIKSIQNEKD